MDIEEQEAQARKWVEGGYRLKTKKGAAFIGYAEAEYYNLHMRHWGIVLIAGDTDFAGCVHVYPVSQLEPA